MNTLKVKRIDKEIKSKTISLRLKPSQVEEFETIKSDLGFKTITDLVCFSMDILKRFHEWNELNYQFYIGNPEKKDFKQVEIDF